VFSELSSLFRELNDFSGTYEGEVKWIKEKEKPLVLEVIKGKFLELTGGADPRVRFEVRSNFADGGSDDLTGHVRYIINYL